MAHAADAPASSADANAETAAYSCCKGFNGNCLQLDTVLADLLSCTGFVRSSSCDSSSHVNSTCQSPAGQAQGLQETEQLEGEKDRQVDAPFQQRTCLKPCVVAYKQQRPDTINAQLQTACHEVTCRGFLCLVLEQQAVAYSAYCL